MLYLPKFNRMFVINLLLLFPYKKYFVQSLNISPNEHYENAIIYIYILYTAGSGMRCM